LTFDHGNRQISHARGVSPMVVFRSQVVRAAEIQKHGGEYAKRKHGDD
jgi:hypothetical protein